MTNYELRMGARPGYTKRDPSFRKGNYEGRRTNGSMEGGVKEIPPLGRGANLRRTNGRVRARLMRSLLSGATFFFDVIVRKTGGFGDRKEEWG